MSFEKYRRGEYDIALQVLEECNDVCAGKIEVKCKKCYNHVLEACKAFCLLQHGLKEDAENVSSPNNFISFNLPILFDTLL